MVGFKKKYRKLFRLFGILLILYFLVTGYLNIKDRIPELVKQGLNKYLCDIDFDSLKFKDTGLIEIKNVIIKDESGQEVVSAPVLYLKYDLVNIMKGYLIKEIEVISPDILIERDKENNINIVDLFTKSDDNVDNKVSKSKKTEKSGNKNIAPGVPINRIIVKNAKLRYIDKAYNKSIIVDCLDVNGFVSFVGKIKLGFQGDRKENTKEKIFFGLENFKEGTQLWIKLKDINIDNDLMQYSYDVKGLKYNSGIVNMDLKILNDSLNGFISTNDVELSYEHIKNKVSNFNSYMEFNNKNILIKSDGYLNNKKIDFNLNKRNNDVLIEFDGENISTEFLENNVKQIEKIPLKGSFEKLKALIIYENEKTDIKLIAHSEQLKYKQHRLKNVKTELTYKINDNRFLIDQLDFDSYINIFDDKELTFKANFSGDYIEDRFRLNYKLYKDNSIFAKIPLTGFVEYYHKDEIIKISNKQDDYKIDGKIDLKTGENHVIAKLIDKTSHQTKIDLDLKFNHIKKIIYKANGDIELDNGDILDKLILKFKNVKNIIKFEKISLKSGKNILDLNGEFNYSNSKMFLTLTNLAFYTKKNKIIDLPETINLDLKSKGTITATLGKKIEFNGTIDSNGNSIVDYEKLHGKLNVKYNNGFFLNFYDIRLKNIGYEDIVLKDLVGRIKISNNILYIPAIYNNILTIKGDYNIISSLQNINFIVNNYNLGKISSLRKIGFSGNIEKIIGKLTGKIANPKIELDIKKSDVSYEKIESIPLTGKITYFNNIVDFNNFKIKRNLINGKINFSTKELQLKLNLLEDNLNAYYRGAILKYRVIGETNLWGGFKDLSAVANLNLDNLYLKGEKLPDLSIKLSLKDGNLIDKKKNGFINLTKFKFLDDNRDELINLVGYFDLSKSFYRFDLNNVLIKAKNIQYLLNNSDIDGNLFIDGKIMGKIGFYNNYNLTITGKKLRYEKILIEEISSKIFGNMDKLNLEYFKMLYDDNELNANGYYQLDNSRYNFKLKGDNIDLSFLQLFIEDNLNNFKGKADLNLNFDEKKGQGYFNLKDFGFKTKDNLFYLENTNGSVRLNEDKIFIENFSGLANDGEFSIGGQLKIPQKIIYDDIANEILNSYSLSLNVKNFNLKYGDGIKVVLSSNLAMEKDLITGELIIENGEIRKIPSKNNKESVEQTSKEEKIKKEESILDYIKTDIAVKTIKPIQFASKDIPFVEEIDLNLYTDGNIKLIDGNINYTGKIYSEDGILLFNNKKFDITKVNVAFTEKNEYFPDVNPMVELKSKTTINEEDIFITIQGPYNEMKLNLSSSSGYTHEEISKYILFGQGENVSIDNLVADVLDKQISSELFDPLSNEFEKILNVSSVKINSPLFKQNSNDELAITENLILGAEIEVQNPFYKDYIFWNAKTKFSDINPGEVDAYDVWFNYKVNQGFGYRVGVQQLQNDLKDENNIYFGIDFKYQFRSIFDPLSE